MQTANNQISLHMSIKFLSELLIILPNKYC